MILGAQQRFAPPRTKSYAQVPFGPWLLRKRRAKSANDRSAGTSCFRAAHNAAMVELNALIRREHAIRLDAKRARTAARKAELAAEYAANRAAINAAHDACDAAYRAVMDADDEAASAAVVGVVAGRELAHHPGEVVGERHLLIGGAETDLGVDAQRREELALGIRPAREGSDLAHDACAQRDEVTGRETVGRACRVGRLGGLAQRGGGDHIGGGGGHEQPLGEPAVTPGAGLLHQTVRLERAQVVVDLLA